ncbi:MAG: wax ester/triacylglycerol synthase family O-acyltransferase [Deltaproteobacteria bacterium]|nr:wax ester/triacylglycerol synthase family O-acyltransferase [Deltaproteobacteria bacterium]
MTSSSAYQLPDGDSVFLAMETDVSKAHIGSLTLLDPSSSPDFSFAGFVDHVGKRLELVPRFTWKLKEVPLGFDNPYWVENPDFDYRKHIHRIAVPSPGSVQELAKLASYLHEQPLDRSRSLWELWFIEGVADGKCALYMKVHHCLMDGASGAGLSEVLADLTPDADRPMVVPEVYDEATPREPTSWELLRNGLRNDSNRRRALVGHLGRGLKEMALEALGQSEAPLVDEVPRVSFNGQLSKRRGLAYASLPLEKVKDLKKHFDVKVNDVVLAVVSSALRRYLRDRDELPEQPLVVMCPVSTRAADDAKLENQITQMSLPIATDEGDPIARLAEIHANSNRAKEEVKAGSFDILNAMGESLSPGLMSMLVGAADLAGDSGPLPGNFVVSNVRATPVPLYLAGARVDTLMPMSVLATGQGLNVTVVSYCDKIDIGLTVDPEMVPDAWHLAEYFPAALDELESAAEGVVHRAR